MCPFEVTTLRGIPMQPSILRRDPVKRAKASQTSVAGPSCPISYANNPPGLKVLSTMMGMVGPLLPQTESAGLSISHFISISCFSPHQLAGLELCSFVNPRCLSCLDPEHVGSFRGFFTRSRAFRRMWSRLARPQR
jgi:hypothetical protein